MDMIAPNAMMEPVDPARAWSQNESELNAYLQREWQFRPYGTRSRCAFCSGNGQHVRPVHRRREVSESTAARSRIKTTVVSTLLLLLRGKETGQGREIG
jgi:hypothetical protein